MATSLTSFKPAPTIRASSSSSRRPDPDRRKPSSVSAWWAPLFGWSSEPSYLADSASGSVDARPGDLDPEAGSGPARSKFSLGCFTEEKAKQLRRKTREGASFHDIMYHSAIASRLASDVSAKQED